jgi:uncharacterized membrane protein
VELEAIFKFVSKHPAMALVCGGILCLILAALMKPFYPASAEILLAWAPWLIGGGVLLHVLWLFRDRIGELLS